jgi:septal ring factor EnvC (AmiA/AmiB activator)
MRIASTLIPLLALANLSHADLPSLEKKLADLEQRLSSLQTDLKELRKEMDAAKTPI